MMGRSSRIGEPDEGGLSGPQPQLLQVHAAVFRQGAAVGAQDDHSVARKPRPAQVELHLLRRPVESSQEAVVLIPDAQVRQGGVGVEEEEEVSEQQGALFPAQLTDGAEKSALSWLPLLAEKDTARVKTQGQHLFLRILKNTRIRIMLSTCRESFSSFSESQTIFVP